MLKKKFIFERRGKCVNPEYESGEEILNEDDITRKVIEYVTSPVNVARLNQCERGEITREEFKNEISEYIRKGYGLDDEGVERVYATFSRFIWSYYIIDSLIDDADISDIRILDYRQIYVKRHGKRERAELSFADSKDYDRFVERVVLKNKVNIGNQNAVQKFTDATLEKWILRFNVSTKFVMSTKTTHIHIRKHPKEKKLLANLVREGMMTDRMRQVIEEKIHAGESFLLCGTGGAGKTTLMNAMLEEIPDSLSIFCVQDAEELFSVREREFCPYHTVEGRGEGKIEYSLNELASNGLLTDSDVYMIGEIKGAEARDFLIAAHTGAICYGSIHAPSVEDAFVRLADYVKRVSDYSVDEVIYMLRGLKNVIFLAEYRIADMAETVWDDKEKKISFQRYKHTEMLKKR